MPHRDPRSSARVLLGVALAIGVLGEIALDGPAPGINVLLMTVVVLGVAWLARRRGRAPDPIDTWLPVTAIVLAAGIGIRADPFLALLDLAGVAVFTGASVAAFSGLAVTRRSLSVVLLTGVWVMQSALVGTGRLVRAARPPRRDGPRDWPDWFAPVVRGLVLAIPLVMIFAVLFASADPIFQRGMDDLLDFRIDLGDLPGRVLFAAGIAWLVGGLLAVAARGIPAVEAASLGAAAPPASIGITRSLGTTEALVVLDRCRPDRRPVRRAPGGLSVRRARHARRGRHDLQRLRASRLFRTRRGGRARRRPAGVPRVPGHRADAAVRGRWRSVSWR